MHVLLAISTEYSLRVCVCVCECVRACVLYQVMVLLSPSHCAFSLHSGSYLRNIEKRGYMMPMH